MKIYLSILYEDKSSEERKQINNCDAHLATNAHHQALDFNELNHKIIHCFFLKKNCVQRWWN